MKKLKNIGAVLKATPKGITLIALIITVIVLLILAGVSINLVLGENGIIAQAKWSAYVTEYEAVAEQKELYAGGRYMEQYSEKKEVKQIHEIATLTPVAKTTEDKILMYPVSNKLNINNMYNSFKESIKYLENLQDNDLENEDLVNLYQVDFNKIEANAKKTYAINIVSGMLYSIEYEKYQGKYYHTPRIGFKIDENGGLIEEVQTELNIKDPGKYNVIINANEIVKWDSIEVVYNKFVEGTATVSSTTTNNLNNWKEVNLEEAQLSNKREKYDINNAENSQYIKISINLEENASGENSEIYYVKVNYYKLEKTDIKPEIQNSGAEVSGGIYTVPTQATGNGSTQASGKATVTQTVKLPTGDDSYTLDLKEYGNPSTTITITKPDGTVETITRDKLIPGGSTVTITTTLNAGDGVEEVQVLKKDDKLSSITSSTVVEKTEEWSTVEQKQYMYSNGGRGFWEKCLINDKVVGATGIIDKDSNRRIQVLYQTSTDGSEWSGPFTDLNEAENKRYLKVLVNYQTKNDTKYGDTSSDKVTVMINDGYLTATFKDADGNVLYSQKSYYINSAKEAKVTTLTTAPTKTGKKFLGWLVGSTPVTINTEYTMKANTEFVAEYMPIDIYTVADLTKFRDLVNRGITYEGVTVNLMNDIDLSSVCNNTKGDWTPIGNYNINNALLFNGIFNGKNYEISNMYIKSASQYQALFGRLGSKGKIQNLTVQGNIVNSDKACGVCCINEGIIEKCSNKVLITGGSFIAGISSENYGTITKSRNIANLIASAICLGGITASNWEGGLIEECYNTAAIRSTAENSAVAGIVGALIRGSIKNCYNTGNVSGGSQIGGIVGGAFYDQVVSDEQIINNYNVGTIIKITAINDLANGGIIGARYTGQNLTPTSNGIVSNNYYLSGTASGGIQMTDVSGAAVVKRNEYFTSSGTTSVMYLLNGSKTSGVWARSSTINNGYPYLVNNVPE